ncbi:hypothetical protein BDY24DRAFT_148854 [Mrakia frigida]|uniref:copper acquisition factor BIM1-like domain-containing protein n=1 Tax=Mrakia frigida TaxID=29902 RepID=UPI003FCC0AA1
MQTGPCGEGSVLNRTNYPLSDGQFSIHIYHASYDIEFSYTTDAVPTSSSTFNTWNTLNNGGLIGQICLATPDFDTADSFAVGQDLTFQMKYTSGDTNATFYQCADVTLTAAEDAVAFSYCYNATESESVASADAAATTTAAWTGYTKATTTGESAAGASSTGAAAVASASATAAASTGGAGRTVAVGGLGAFALGVAALWL